MRSEWPTVRLGDHVNACLGKMLDAQKNKGTPQPYLGNSNVRWGAFDLTDLAEMRFETGEEERYELHPGDLVVCEGGEPGRCAIWTGPRGMKFQKALHRIRPRATLDNYYLFNWFRQAARTGQLDAHFTGTTIKHLTGRAVAELRVPLPPLAEQLAMVDVLRPLDERITLLRESNATLEAIAQALFKSWFVDFDPVRAKMEGRAPEGMDEATAALFPDSFQESALGLLPAGWECIDLSDLTKRFGGSIQTGPFGSQLHASDYVESGVPVVMPKDIMNRRASTDSIARIRSTDADRLSRHKLMAGDIVFSRRGDVERHALITDREIGWLCGTGCLLVRPGPGWRSPGFLSMLLDAARARTWLVQHAVGATMPNLNTGILGSVPVVLPSNSTLSAFEELVSVTEEQRSRNASMAETLAALRDTLLPRLISGELRLPDAEALAA
ncbi:MAG: restriction endonuclease subunit S [Burkholderiales bacterium]|nr:restriction endonuclease subunit S [Burkholderiales bacterium]